MAVKTKDGAIGVRHDGVYQYFSSGKRLDLDRAESKLLDFPELPWSPMVRDVLRSQVYALFDDKTHMGRAVWKEVRAHLDRSQHKGWQDVLPFLIVRWANLVLKKESADSDCVGNYRCARMKSSSQRRRYRKQFERGCCGFRDFSRTGPDGRQYILGFNYGH